MPEPTILDFVQTLQRLDERATGIEVALGGDRIKPIKAYLSPELKLMLTRLATQIGNRLDKLEKLAADQWISEGPDDIPV